MFSNTDIPNALPNGLVVNGKGAQNELTIRKAHYGRADSSSGEGVVLRGATIRSNRDVPGAATIEVIDPLWRDDEEDACKVAMFDIVGFNFTSAPFDGVMYFSGWLVGGAWYPAGTTAETAPEAYGARGSRYDVRKHDGTDAYCHWSEPHFAGAPYTPPVKTFAAHEVEICVRPITFYGYRLVVDGKKQPVVGQFYTEEEAEAARLEAVASAPEYNTITSARVMSRYGTRKWEKA